MATLMVSTCRSSLASLTPTEYTLFVFAAETNRRATQAGSPSAGSFLPARQTMSVGCGASGSALIKAPSCVWYSLMEPSVQLVTKNDLPDGANKTRYGRRPV